MVRGWGDKAGLGSIVSVKAMHVYKEVVICSDCGRVFLFFVFSNTCLDATWRIAYKGARRK